MHITAPCSTLRCIPRRPYCFTHVALWRRRTTSPHRDVLSLTCLLLLPHPVPDECFPSCRAAHKEQQPWTTRTSPREVWEVSHGGSFASSLHRELAQWSRKTPQWGTQRKMAFWESGKISRCRLSNLKVCNDTVVISSIPQCLDIEGPWSK